MRKLLTLGVYDNFPQTLHHVETFTSNLSTKQLQQKIIQTFSQANRVEYDFEEVANPTIPNGKVIFEFGLAESGGFNFLDERETQSVLDFLEKARINQLDFFCAIRYYKCSGAKKSALKFDYYLFRTIFGKATLEMRVFHERGPRYISPQDLTAFVINKVNEASNKKILRTVNL